jgi:cytosine/adenosine deaminase-related metal-dependent hydrolase
LFEGALRGGSQALGVSAAHVGIVVGAPADLVALRGEAAAFAGRGGDALLDTWIFAAVREAVDEVWRAGEKVVTGGRHHAREPVEKAWREVLHRLLHEAAGQ